MANPSGPVYTDSEVDDQVAQWGLPNTEAGRRMALEYMLTLHNNSFYATGILLQYTVNGITGVLMAVSTPLSTRVCKQNHVVLEERGIPGRIISACSFQFFHGCGGVVCMEVFTSIFLYGRLG